MVALRSEYENELIVEVICQVTLAKMVSGLRLQRDCYTEEYEETI